MSSHKHGNRSTCIYVAINGPYKIRKIETDGKNGNHTNSAITIRHIIMQCSWNIAPLTGNVTEAGWFGNKNGNITLSKNDQKEKKVIKYKNH